MNDTSQSEFGLNIDESSSKKDRLLNELSETNPRFDLYLSFFDYVVKSKNLATQEGFFSEDKKSLEDFVPTHSPLREYLSFLREHKNVFNVLQDWYKDLEANYFTISRSTSDPEEIPDRLANQKLNRLFDQSILGQLNSRTLLRIADTVMRFSYNAYVIDKAREMMKDVLQIPVNLEMEQITLLFPESGSKKVSIKNMEDGTSFLTMPPPDFSYGFALDERPNPLIDVYSGVHELTHVYTDQVLQKKPKEEIPLNFWLVLQEVGSFLAEEKMSQLEINGRKPYEELFSQRELKHSRKQEHSEHLIARNLVKAARLQGTFRFEEYTLLLQKLHNTNNLMDYRTEKDRPQDYLDVLLKLI